MRALIAFSMRQEGVDSLFFTIRDRLEDAGVEAVSSVDHHRKTFHDNGGWDGWIDSIVNGTDYLTRRPNFNVLVCTERVLGRATAQMVKGFLDQKKDVLFFGNTSFSSVRSLQENDGEDWQKGWSILIDK
jgi:hypothetical protein